MRSTRKQAEEAKRSSLQAQQAATQKQIGRSARRVGGKYPDDDQTRLHVLGGKNNPFNVTAIYHDDRFTYIEAAPEEAPSVYEVKDGKPSPDPVHVQGRPLHDSEDPDDGYLRVGKSELKFHRETAG